MSKPLALECSASANLTRFARFNPEWSASSLLSAVEAIRATQRVPFYLYDFPDIPMRVAHELEKVRTSCKSGSMWDGEYWFMRSLVRHPWRVFTPKRAEILIIPSLVVWSEATRHMRCTHLTHFSDIMKAVYNTSTWRERREDHLWTCMLWKQGNAAPGMHAPIFRAGVETRYNEPMWHDHFIPRPAYANGTVNDWLIAAPYVDAGFGDARGETAFSPDLEVFNFSSTRNRDIPFFFGGRTSTAIGPGRAQKGYYPRWWLMQQWASDPSDFDGLLQIADSDKITVHSLPAARVCDPPQACRKACTSTLPSRLSDACTSRCVLALTMCTASGCDPTQSCRRACPSNSSMQHQLAADVVCSSCLARVQQGSKAWNHSRGCLSICGNNEHPSSSTDQKGRSSACLGVYSAREALQRARFSLCIRGDVPSSPRPFEAIRSGAIPVFISDNLWRISLPFQCFVPWRLMTFTIPEQTFASGAARALRSVLASVSPKEEERMRHLLSYFGRDVLFRHPDSRVAENLLIETIRWRSWNRGQGTGCCPLGNEIID